MKSLTLLSLAIALAALPGVSVAGVTEMQALVAKKAAIVKTMHDKATLAIVQVAQDAAFPSYFEAAHLGDHDHAHEAKVRIDNISLATQVKFHVEEMCLIDISGAEVSRIVQNQIAYDLSLEEASASFFAPSFARAPRSTYIAPLYVSPDVARWVIAYTTPIEVDGKNAAILHYEHGLDTYQAALNKAPAPANTYVVAVDSHGFIVSDSRRPIPIEQVGESGEPADYFEPFVLNGLHMDGLKAALGSTAHGTISDAGSDFAVAYRQVADWTIFAIEKI